MTYNAPAGNLADASWVGANAYTPPAGGAADAEWLGLSYDVLVAVATPLGAPSVRAQAVLQARAADTAAMGAFRAFVVTPVFVRATGFSFVSFGSPTAINGQQATGIYSTAFGTPSSPVPQTVEASPIPSLRLGTPVLFLSTVVRTDLICAASPVATGQLGVPSSLTNVTVRADGSAGSYFGMPWAGVRRSAQAIGPSLAFGLPSTALSLRVQGYAVTVFGTPVAAAGQRSASTFKAPRWGVPTCVRSNTYLARGITPSPRFGRPSGRKINAYQASAVGGAGHFGAPACTQRYRALGAYDGARFGKPLLRRNPTC